MKYFWIVLVALSLAACGSGKAPPPDKYARFVGNTGEQLQTDKQNFEAYQSILTAMAADPFVSIVLQILGLSDAGLEVDWASACLVNVVGMNGNVINSQFHTVSSQCDCLAVVPGDAAQCVGDVLAEDAIPVFVEGTIEDEIGLLDLFSFAADQLCPAIEGTGGIPFIPPDCLGSAPPPSEVPNLSVSRFASFFGAESPSLESFVFDGVQPDLVNPYLTANGEQAQAFTYKNVDNKYDDCFLDAQVALGFDEEGNIVPAAKQPEDDVVASSVYRVVDHYLVSSVLKTCTYTIEATTSDNANSEGVDNALSPYEGLDITVTTDFDVLEEGVLSLDYDKVFYKVSRN